MRREAGSRMCISCRKYKHQKELVRIIKNDRGILVSPDRFTFGRSVYLCKDEACIRRAEEKRLLGKRVHSAYPDDIFDRIRRALDE